jgi:predicted O-linked N-acetylglucosamine transferase (SPINDLY family)
MAGASSGARKSLERARSLHRKGDLAEAERLVQSVLQRNGADVDALQHMALLQVQRGALEAARQYVDRALGLEPARAELHCLRAEIAGSLGWAEQALESYAEALALRPDYFDALVNMSDALLRAGRAAEALALCDRALRLRPADLASLNNRGNALQALKRHEEALACFDRVRDALPDNPDVLSNRASVLLTLGRFGDAEAECRQALAAKADHAMALLNLGRALGAQGKLEEAVRRYDAALALRPSEFDAWCDRAGLLRELQRPREAAESLRRALELRPDSAGTWSDLAATLVHAEDFAAALAACARALALDAGLADAWSNRGLSLLFLERYDEAMAAYDKAFALDPRTPYAIGHLAWLRLRAGDWHDAAQLYEHIAHGARAERPFALPFEFLFFSDRASEQLACARAYSRDKYPTRSPLLWTGERYRHERIRLAYISADFREHPASHLLAGLFERHDRARFEVYGVSIGPRDSGPTAARVAGAFEHFLHVRERTNREIAQLLRDFEIDIAVDLMWDTTHGRPAIYAHRPCPLQVNYLGFPGTTGSSFHDYLIADSFLVPVGRDGDYSEKVVRLPDSFQANDSVGRGPGPAPTRLEAGLPPQGVVFCSFNKSPKITPEMFGVWMDILREVPGSVLWLWGGDASLERNLRREAETRGVAPERLVFAPGLPYAKHLARLQCADIALDTLPFNGGATTSDALRCGVPMVTLPGDALAARMSGSLLHAIGMPELVTSSRDEYRSLAVRLGQDEALLARTKAKLEANRRTQPLFDTERFRRHIEAAYEIMWRRHQSGEAPESFTVPPLPAEH